jgi:hypothetical protein
MKVHVSLLRWSSVVLGVTLTVLVLLGSPARLWAQGAVTSASLSGNVVDTSGAAIPGATVTILNTATGVSKTQTADAHGHFIFLQLAPGTYSIVATGTGFKKSEVPSLTLTVGETQTMRIEMQVGTVQQTVEVSAAVSTIGTTESVVGSTMQPLQISSLPLNQRSFTALVTQQPGMVKMTNTTSPTVLSAATNTGSMISAEGTMGSTIAYLMDGVNFSNGSMSAPGTAAAGDMPGVAAMQEFKVLTHLYSARYGGASSTVVSFATRGGTNNFHGSVYNYLRNDIFDARSFFDSQKPPYKRNQFGATFGGPIQKNRTFFFANYEGLRQRLSTTNIAFVPTDCARNGGVGGSCNFPVIGPTGDPVAISPDVKAILNLYPTPTGPELFPGSGIAPSAFLNYQPTGQDFGVIKVDHDLTSKDHISARYQITEANASQDYNLPSFQFLRADRDQNLMLQWARTISPRLVNTLSFSFLRTNLHSSTLPVQALQSDQYTGNAARQTIGVITVGSGTAGVSSGTLTALGNDDGSPFHLAQNNFPINDDVVFSSGRHTLHFGGMINRMQWNWSSATIPGGSYTFLSLNDLLAANPSVLLIHREGVDTSYGIRTTALAWYVEDAWQVSPRLTLTAGLRHDFQVPILSDKNGRLGSWPSPTATSIRTGTPYNNYSLTQFQPRVGLAWDVFGNGKTVVRTGYGLYNSFINFSTNAQGILQWNAPGPALNTFFGWPIAPGYLPVIPFPTCSNCTDPTPYAGLVTGMMLPVNSPTANQWDLEVAQMLPWHLALDATYSGSQSYHIPRKAEENYNLPCSTENGLPVFPAVPGQCGTGAPGIAGIGFSLYARLYDTTSNYNAFSIKVNRAFASNFVLQTSYTFAKAMSVSDAFNSGNFIQGIAEASSYPANNAVDRSQSVYSIRHRFTENFVWNLPMGRGQRYLGSSRGVTDAILGGWKLSTLATVQSGLPFTVFAGVPITGVGDNIDYPDRPNIVSANTVSGGPDHYLNLKAYALQDYGHLGTAPRTSARGPGFADVDLSIGKKFALTEKTNLEFRADIFNLLNHANFALPFNQIYTPAPQFSSMPTQSQLNALPCTLTGSQSLQYSCNPQAGKISSTVGVPREIQFSLKFEF